MEVTVSLTGKMSAHTHVYFIRQKKYFEETCKLHNHKIKYAITSIYEHLKASHSRLVLLFSMCLNTDPLCYFVTCYSVANIQGSLPKMGFPRGVLPPKVKTWEWSAVTTVSVSDSLVSCAAR